MSEHPAPPDHTDQKKKKSKKHKRPSSIAAVSDQGHQGYVRTRDLASQSDWLFCEHTGDCLVERPEIGQFASSWDTPYSVPLDGALKTPVLVAFGAHTLAEGVLSADITHHTRVIVSDMEKVYQEFALDPSFVRPPTMEEAILKDRTLKIRATIDERCPQCSFTGMEYYTAQLRSADEGQTVFFECPQCRYKWSTNN